MIRVVLEARILTLRRDDAENRSGLPDRETYVQSNNVYIYLETKLIIKTENESNTE